MSFWSEHRLRAKLEKKNRKNKVALDDKNAIERDKVQSQKVISVKTNKAGKVKV